MPHRTAVLLLIVASIMWSFGGVMIKSVDLPSLAKAGARSAVAAVVMLAWLRRPKFTFSPVQIGAALAYAGTVIFFIAGTDRTTAANAIFLQYTAPIYVALLGHWVLGERTRRIDWICIAVALAGIGLFFRDQLSPTGTLGIVFSLASGMCSAGIALLMRLEKDQCTTSSLLLGNLITAIVCLPLGFHRAPTSHETLILVLMGVVQLGVPYILYSIAIRRVTALEAILIPALEPILNPIWVALSRHEIPGPWSIAGGALVLGAVILRGVWGTRG